MGGESVSAETLDRVLNLINRPSLTVLDEYYNGEQPLKYLPPHVRAELGDRIPTIVLNVPRVAVGSIEERLDVDGFSLSRNDAAADESLSDIWQANDLDEWSQLCHIEALKHGISFVTVWANDDDPRFPRIAVESAHQMAVEYAPGTREVQAAAKVWEEQDPDNADVKITRAVLYLPDRIEHYSRKASPMIMVGGGQWQLDDTIDNPLGVVPVVPFVNRPSLTDMSGQSELKDVMPLTDGINKLLSDMLVTAEHHAEPRRYATGVQIPAGAANNERLRAEVREKWREALAGDTWLGGKDVNFGQFSAADLQNFVAGVNLLLGKAAFITGLSPHMLGITTENPASAEAIRSSETPLIRRVRRKMRTFGGSWERVMRLALLVRDGSVPDEALSMFTLWANPETQTFSQDADAVQKLVSSDPPVITVRAARERLRFSPTEIKRMEEDEEDARTNGVTSDVAARIAQARELQRTEGLNQQAALAAVGLTIAAAAQASGAPVAPGN